MDKKKHGGDRKSIVGRIGMLRSEVAETAGKSEAILYLAAKEERFAQAIARGRSQTDAAIDAGYAVLSAHVQGSRLMKKDKIKARVVQLCSGTSATTSDVREEHLAQLISLREAAMSKGQISAAIKADDYALLTGMIGGDLGCKRMSDVIRLCLEPAIAILREDAADKAKKEAAKAKRQAKKAGNNVAQ